MAQRYRTRPSELLELDDAYAAYCLDQAVLTFCAGVESKLDAVPTPKGKKGEERRQQNQTKLLQKLLGIEEKEEDKAKKFKDPAAMFAK
jgi:hypothetical protein